MSDHRIVSYVQIHDGYPTDSILGQKSSHESFVIRYDANTRKLVDNYYDATPDAISKVSSSPPVYRFKFGITLPDVKTGDLVAVRVPSHFSNSNQISQIFSTIQVRRVALSPREHAGHTFLAVVDPSL